MFQLSPGVNVSEIDLTTVVPAVATTDGAISGIFRWGPVDERVLVDSETILAKRYGNPTNLNAETWFSAANFLSYGNRLHVNRAANTSGLTPEGSFTVQVGNNVIVTTNTTGFIAGMYLTQTSNSAMFAPSLSLTVNNVVNSTALQLTSPASNTGSVSLIFGRPETSYSALALAATNAVVSNLVNQIVKNENDYTNKDGQFDTDVLYVAKYPGAMGNSLRVSVCDSPSAYTSNVNVGTNGGSITFNIGNNVAVVSGLPNSSIATTVGSTFAINDRILAGNSAIDFQYLKITNILAQGNSTQGNVVFTFEDPYRLHTVFSTNNISRYWEFFNVVDAAPGRSNFVGAQGNTAANDEIHIVVVDNGGSFTGTPGTVLEVYKGLSRANDSKNDDNTDNYYKTVINNNSPYIWWANDRAEAPSANASMVRSSTSVLPGNYQLVLGSDGFDESNVNAFSVIAAGYNKFAAAEEVDISLVLQGRPLGGTTTINGVSVSGFQLANYIIDNICEIRKDCVALVSPPRNLTLNAFGVEATNVVAFRGALRSTSYAVLDSGYKYQYDRYNDVYRWVPLNGDIAGLCARTDQTNDAWWSPAGYNRGQIKNIIKLAWNPRKADRDILYSNGINPVVTFPGQGTILYGDKTLLAKPSAFDRINVRRLFIVLEKAIATAAKFSLFEFNDTFTRSQFKNLVNPYLRQVQGRRGITDFLVVCDETNNTAQVIDSGQFVGDIYIKPARSINFIQLNFVAVGTGVQFSEVIGKFG